MKTWNSKLFFSYSQQMLEDSAETGRRFCLYDRSIPRQPSGRSVETAAVTWGV